MAQPTLSPDEIDDLLYAARTADAPLLTETLTTLTTTHPNTSPAQLLALATDDATGNGAAHYAAANGHTDILQLLANHTTPTDEAASPSEATQSPFTAPNNAGNTPLHYAALNGHLAAVRWLVRSGGADMRTKNGAGHDAVFEAERGGREGGEAVVAFLLGLPVEGEEVENGEGGGGDGIDGETKVDEGEEGEGAKDGEVEALVDEVGELGIEQG